MRVALLLADGFEEIEALTPLDVLRRAEIAVDTIGVGKDVITGSHGIKVHSDNISISVNPELYDFLILPGGMPGASNLDACPLTDKLINSVLSKNGHIAAICAAPFILGKRGLLRGIKAVCYPGFENMLDGAIASNLSVVTDGSFTTAKGMGVALEFALEIVKIISGEDKACAIAKQIMMK